MNLFEHPPQDIHDAHDAAEGVLTAFSAEHPKLIMSFKDWMDLKDAMADEFLEWLKAGQRIADKEREGE